MISYTKDLWGNVTASGFETLEDAEADCARLKAAYGEPYSFTVLHPAAQEADGTFSFKYWKASSCD